MVNWFLQVSYSFYLNQGCLYTFESWSYLVFFRFSGIGSSSLCYKLLVDITSNSSERNLGSPSVYEVSTFTGYPGYLSPWESLARWFCSWRVHIPVAVAARSQSVPTPIAPSSSREINHWNSTHSHNDTHTQKQLATGILLWSLFFFYCLLLFTFFVAVVVALGFVFFFFF